MAILTDPVGAYLLGSWSPEQESTMHVVPRLYHALGSARSSRSPES